MAVYTHLGAEDLSRLIAHYDVGQLVSAKGIAEGVSNSNWLIETTGKYGAGARYILTMYERRIELADLPFFLDLMDHLADHGCPVPRTIHDREGSSFRMLASTGSPSGHDKAVALIEYLPGISVDRPTIDQARSVGKALARNHLAVADFGQDRPNDMGLGQWQATVMRLGREALERIDPALPGELGDSMGDLAEQWPSHLPEGVVHCDLFPDNVLLMGNKVTGLIDFYFSATDYFAYDLAVTHAAWSFSADGHQFNGDVARALMAGYESARRLDAAERRYLPVLAKGACIRFITSRAEDWITTPDDALVTRKDPLDFVRRLRFYGDHGAKLFEAEQ